MYFKQRMAVLGVQWGDEGKGKIIDWLGSHADVVVRFQGGHNAGHTIVVDGHKRVLKLLPSAILHEHVQALIAQGVVLEPENLLQEVATLKASGVEVAGRLGISQSCPLILPSHVALDRARESQQTHSIGTTGRGIGPTYEDKAARRSIRVSDLFAPKDFHERLERCLEHHNFLLSQYSGNEAFEVTEVFDQYMAYAEQLKPWVIDVSQCLHQLQRENKRIIFEGAQGTALDIDHGTYPYVTSSHTTIGGVMTGCGISHRCIDAVWGISKVYATRVGEGPFPTELQGESAQYFSEKGQEIGAVTGRLRRCGWLDAVMLKQAIALNGVDAMCLTKLDVLDNLTEIKLCVAYLIGGERVAWPPQDPRQYAACQPEYLTFPGWRCSTQGIDKWQDLPELAQNFIKQLRRQLTVPIALLSTGPGREALITLTHDISG